MQLGQIRYCGVVLSADKTDLTIICPIRGTLKTKSKSSDGLTSTEEYFRVEAIKFLIEKGYPVQNFIIEPVIKRFGNSGKNSMRADFAILDINAKSIDKKNIDELMDHALLLCEVKRDNSKADYVKSTQVKPLLEFAKVEKCCALYWDNIEHRVFWNEFKKGKRKIQEGPLHLLPIYGGKVVAKTIVFNQLNASNDLIDVFSRIENVLHAASIDLEERYSTMLQLILGKLYDEHSNINSKKPLEIQDFSSLEVPPDIALSSFKKLLSKAISYYSKHLPKPISKNLPKKLNGEHIYEIARIISPIKLTGSKREVVQTFYMKFAKDLYKWDLAQYFTPPPVTDFIVSVLNIGFGEHIKDPACGSADFLTAAFHIGREFDNNFSDSLQERSYTFKMSNALNIVLFTKCTNLCNSIEMYLKNDYPLIICYAVANLGHIKLCLAPQCGKD